MYHDHVMAIQTNYRNVEGIICNDCTYTEIQLHIFELWKISHG